MVTLFDDLPKVAPGKRLKAQVDGLFRADGDNFVTAPVDRLDLTYDGIPGDFHAGITRKSGGREPWYERGTEMRNERQLSIVCRRECAIVADKMGLQEIRPEWIGANISLEGIDMFSMLPASTLLFFAGGATVKIDFQNGPCRFAGATIADGLGRHGDMDIALGFAKAAKRRRGVVAWVEKPGAIELGEEVTVQVPEQWIYPA